MELVKNVDRFLNVDKMREINQAFVILNNMLEDLKLPRVNLEDCTVSRGMSPKDVPQKINAVEKNIQALHYAVQGKIDGWNDVYFKEFTWQGTVKNKLSEVNRWVNWINDFNTMLNHVQIEYIPLYYGEDALYTKDDKPLNYIKRIFNLKEIEE